MSFMTKLLNDVYYFRHPLNANCVVFAFLTGNRTENGKEFDLIDTGINRFRIHYNLVKQMHKDGLDPRNVRNIFHGHYHFDHVQADVFFQKKAIRSKEKKSEQVKIYIPAPDEYRIKEGYSIGLTNIKFLTDYFGTNPAKNFPKMPYFAKYAIDPFMKTEPLSQENNNVVFYSDNEELTIGQYKAKIFQTGGHTEGHSFFYFPEIGALHTGDNNALNEVLVDFGAVVRSMIIARDLKPELILIGHNEPKKNRVESEKWINQWFTEYGKVIDMLKPKMKNDAMMNITRLMSRMAGWAYKLEVVRFFAFMQMFVILRYLESKKYGKIEIGVDKKTLYFHLSPNIESMELKLEP